MTRSAGTASGPAEEEDSATSGGNSLGAGFRALFTSNLASSLADGIARTAGPLLAVRLTHDPLLISAVAGVSMLPWLLFAIGAGVIIDRFDRRRVLATASGIRTVLAVLLFVLVATGSLTIWWLYAVLFVYGIGETLYDGAIRAVIPSLVRRDQLPRANGRIEAGEQVLQSFVAAPATSLLFAVSALIPLGVNGAAFALALALSFALPLAAAGRVSGQPPREHTPLRAQVAEGFRFLVGHRILRTLWMFSTGWAFCLTAGTALLPLLAITGLGVPESLYGFLLLTEAAGGLVAAVVVGRLAARIGTGRAMAIASVVSSATLVATGLATTWWWLALALFVNAAAIVVWNVLVISLRQSLIPSRLLGRVHGTWRTLHWGVIPLGSLVGGALGRIDLPLPFVLGGGVSVLATLALVPFFKRLPEPADTAPT